MTISGTFDTPSANEKILTEPIPTDDMIPKIITAFNASNETDKLLGKECFITFKISLPDPYPADNFGINFSFIIGGICNAKCKNAPNITPKTSAYGPKKMYPKTPSNMPKLYTIGESAYDKNLCFD